MKTFQLGHDHKIIISETVRGFEVRLYELTGGRWIPLGQPEAWGKLSDILDEYGITE